MPIVRVGVNSLYEYNAQITNVVDGDTFDAIVDVGFYLNTKLRFRVLGINAPELHGPSHVSGLKAKQVATDLLLDRKVVLQTQKTDVFGRWLAKVTLPDGIDFGNFMIENKQAIPFMIGNK